MKSSESRTIGILVSFMHVTLYLLSLNKYGLNVKAIGYSIQQLPDTRSQTSFRIAGETCLLLVVTSVYM